MSQVFYRVTGGEPLAFCRDFKDRYLAKRREFSAYSEAKGGRGFIEFWGCFGGIIFEDDDTRPAGLKVERRRTREGHTYCTPEKRSAAGKVLRAEFDALGRLPRGDEFAEKFGIPLSLSYEKSSQNYGSTRLTSGGFSTSQVVWAGDELFVVLPDIEAEIAEYVADGYTCKPSSFTPPDGLEKSSKARWELALAEQRVREEEAA